MTTSMPVAAKPTAVASIPSFFARYAKLMWASTGSVLVVATDVVNSYADVLPSTWLTGLNGLILVLTTLGMLRETNALTPAQIVRLVELFMPNHRLVSVNDVAALASLNPVHDLPAESPKVTVTPAFAGDIKAPEIPSETPAPATGTTAGPVTASDPLGLLPSKTA